MGTEMIYARFGGVVAGSALLMAVFIHLNMVALNHVAFTQTRIWTALLGGGVLAGLAMTSLFGRYRDKSTNLAIIVGSIALAAGMFWLLPG